jgi:nucleoside-diphosphate-sugar epimerase
MRIVIFGGGDFIGSAIAGRFLLDGHELRIFERPRVAPYRKFAESGRDEWIERICQALTTLAMRSVASILHRERNVLSEYEIASQTGCYIV